jgi:predicted RNA-binding Zn-ribbon protein involved in translation (DUF1610 family)
MNWFYKQSDRELGPISSETLEELVACGVITRGTLVRKSDSTDWMAYGEVSASDSSGNPSIPAEDTIRFHCPGCGQKISTGAEDVGKQADCPSCGANFTMLHLLLPGLLSCQFRRCLTPLRVQRKSALLQSFVRNPVRHRWPSPAQRPLHHLSRGLFHHNPQPPRTLAFRAERRNK